MFLFAVVVPGYPGCSGMDMPGHFAYKHPTVVPFTELLFFEGQKTHQKSNPRNTYSMIQYAVCHFQKGPFILCQDAEVLRGKVGCLLLT